MRPRILLTLLLATVASAGARAAVFETTVPPREQDKFKSAAYRLWLPDGVKTVRAIIIHQHGCGRNGITNATDAQWQALAARHDAALVGTTLVPRDKCTDWHDPANGSADALLAALKTFAKDTGRPELETAPWCLWGHSGGAHWSFAMAGRFPHRVVAVFARSGGQPAPTAPDLPVCFQFGAKEETDRFAKLFETAWKVYTAGREKDAAWSWAVDPKSSHDTRNSRALAIPFFDACLTARLPADGGTELRPIDRAAGWFSDLKTFDIAPAKQFPGDRANATWLPSEAVAKAWREFVMNGDVRDTTPPPKPTAVTVTDRGGTFTLTWSAAADPESGVAAFNVYRGGRKVAAVPGQTPNYGDEPEPAQLVTTHTGKVEDGQGGAYEVTTVNRAGLESERAGTTR
jgi:pimeloyl-ACP methyl ester carboxylesterase